MKGHRGDQGNEESDKLAKEGANTNKPGALQLHIPEDFDLQGAKLAMLTQAIAYRGIRNHKTRAEQASTNRNIDIARTAIHTYTGDVKKQPSQDVLHGDEAEEELGLARLVSSYTLPHQNSQPGGRGQQTARSKVLSRCARDT